MCDSGLSQMSCQCNKCRRALMQYAILLWPKECAVKIISKDTHPTTYKNLFSTWRTTFQTVFQTVLPFETSSGSPRPFHPPTETKGRPREEEALVLLVTRNIHRRTCAWWHGAPGKVLSFLLLFALRLVSLLVSLLRFALILFCLDWFVDVWFLFEIITKQKWNNDFESKAILNTLEKNKNSLPNKINSKSFSQALFSFFLLFCSWTPFFHLLQNNIPQNITPTLPFYLQLHPDLSRRRPTRRRTPPRSRRRRSRPSSDQLGLAPKETNKAYVVKANEAPTPWMGSITRSPPKPPDPRLQTTSLWSPEGFMGSIGSGLLELKKTEGSQRWPVVNRKTRLFS